MASNNKFSKFDVYAKIRRPALISMGINKDIITDFIMDEYEIMTDEEISTSCDPSQVPANDTSFMRNFSRIFQLYSKNRRVELTNDTRYGKLNQKQISDICFEEFRYMTDEERASYGEVTTQPKPVEAAPVTVPQNVVEESNFPSITTSSEKPSEVASVVMKMNSTIQSENAQVPAQNPINDPIPSPTIEDASLVIPSDYISETTITEKNTSHMVTTDSLVTADTGKTVSQENQQISLDTIVCIIANKFEGSFAIVKSRVVNDNFSVNVIVDMDSKLHHTTIKRHQVRIATQEETIKAREIIDKIQETQQIEDRKRLSESPVFTSNRKRGRSSLSSKRRDTFRHSRDAQKNLWDNATWIEDDIFIREIFQGFEAELGPFNATFHIQEDSMKSSDPLVINIVHERGSNNRRNQRYYHVSSLPKNALEIPSDDEILIDI